MRVARFLFFGIGTIILLFTVALVSGQPEDENACPAFVEAMLQQVAENCADLAVGSACFGVGGLRATFYADGEPGLVIDESLAVPGDIAELLSEDGLTALESLRTARFRLLVAATPEATADVTPETTPEAAVESTPEATPELTPEATVEATSATDEPVSGDWGIGVVYTSAGLPQPVDAAGARVLLIGDARLENGVLPEDAFIPGKPVKVRVTDTPIYTAPPDYPLDAEIIDTVSDTFRADALSVDGEWVRVFYRHPGRFAERAAAWLEVSALDDEPDLAGLPVLAPEQFAPMQRLFLTSARENLECADAPPPGVLVQGADNLETEVILNDVPVSLAGSAYFRQVSPRLLRVAALDGVIVLFPDEEREIVLVPGFAANMCLQGLGDFGIDQVKNDLQAGEACDAYEASLMFVSELGLFSAFSSLPDESLVAAMPSVNVIFASGEGGVLPVVTIGNNDESQEVLDLCAQGSLPDYICSVVNR